MKWGNKRSIINNYCCWCGKAVFEDAPVYGLTAQFRKDVEAPPVEDEGYVLDLLVPKGAVTGSSHLTVSPRKLWKFLLRK